MGWQLYKKTIKKVKNLGTTMAESQASAAQEYRQYLNLEDLCCLITFVSCSRRSITVTKRKYVSLICVIAKMFNLQSRLIRIAFCPVFIAISENLQLSEVIFGPKATRRTGVEAVD